MTIIAYNQGAIRISEVGIDSALPVFATNVNEDGLTLVTQVQQVVSNLLRKSSFLLTSDGVVTWNGSIITNNGNNVFLRLNQNPGVGQVTVMIPTSLLSTYSLVNGNVLYFQTTQNQLAGGSFTANSSNIGVVADSSFPAAVSTQNPASVDQTITVPILAAYTVGGSLAVWWVPHGIYWPQNTTSVVGSIITSTTNPVGTLSAWHLFGQSMPLGTPSASAIAPGYALCDGCVVVNINSAYNNTGRNSNGFPNSSYSSSNDKFTPSLNGPLQNFVGGTAYGIGDKVQSTSGSNQWVALTNFTGVSGTAGADPNQPLPSTWSATTSYTAGQFVYYVDTNVNSSGQTFSGIYKCILNIAGSGSNPNPFLDTTHWVIYWGTNMSENGNPFCRVTANNDPETGLNPSTFVRGATASPSASSSAAYGGSQEVSLTVPNIPSHTHTVNDPSHNHNNYTPTNVGSSGSSLGAQLVYNGPGSPAGVNTQGILYNFTGITLENTGSGTAFNKEPRYFNALWIIKIY